jgi:HEAT repeat protein
VTLPRRAARREPHPSVARWRVATGLLAGSTLFFALRAGPSGGAAPTPAAQVASQGSRAATLRHLRIPGHLVGLDEDQILRELEGARSVQQIQVLCERLGFVGTDRALDLLGGLARDRRPGAAEAAIAAIGHIGTDQATTALLGLLDRTSMRVRAAAVRALGMTDQDRARDQLVALASRRGDPLRGAAIAALGEMGGDGVLDFFRAMPDRSRPVLLAMVQAAATMGGDDAEAFLLELARGDRVHAEVRAAALAALPGGGDDERQAMLMEVLASGDPASAAAAAQVLGRSGARDAIPLLIDVARSGNYQTSAAALGALSEIGTPEAVRALGDLATRGPSPLMQQATYALAQSDTPEARAFLFAAARSGGDRSAAISALTQLGGADVEALLLEVARTGDLRNRQTALQHLLQVGHPDAAALVTELATTGPRSQRQSFLYMMGQLDGEEARDRLWAMTRESSGYTKMQALEVLASSDPGDPRITSTLIEVMRDGRRDEAGSAAFALARNGAPEAREALLAALQGGDRQAATVALGAASQLMSDPDMAAAVVQTARSATDPQLKQAALSQLLQSRLPDGVAVAEQMLKSGRADEATQAISALAQGDPSAADLQRLVRDAARQSEPQVRAIAAGALVQSSDPSSSELLVQLTRDRDPTVRAAALNGLGQVGSREAIGALIEATRGGETQDRQAAIQALAFADDSRASTTLAGLIGSSDPTLAQAAIGASYGGGREVDQALVAALGSENQMIRAAAAYQLRARGARIPGEVQRQVAALIGAEQ